VGEQTVLYGQGFPGMSEVDDYREIFDRRGARYHQAMSDSPYARRTELETAVRLADIEPGHLVCDVPAGGCYLSRYMPGPVDLICVETAKKFLAVRDPQAWAGQVICGDLRDIPLRGGSFDRLISLAGVHHLSDKRGFYREVHRLLGPGGVFVLGDVHAASGVARFLNQFVDRHSTMGHKGVFLDWTTREDLQAAGFTVSSDERIGYTWNFDSVGTMVHFCRSLFGIDQAGDADIRNGISKFLGYFEQGALARMRWELYYLKARK
jgi:SAM-dependent methyltransferase